MNLIVAIDTALGDTLNESVTKKGFTGRLFNRSRKGAAAPRPDLRFISHCNEAWSIPGDKKKNGYLFTVGDHDPAGADRALLQKAQEDYTVFHISIAQGRHASVYPKQVKQRWEELLGPRAIWLTDHTKLAETIISAVDVSEGRDAKESAREWGVGTSSKVVLSAIKDLPKGRDPKP